MMTTEDGDVADYFLLSVTGQIHTAEGIDEGMTQTSVKGYDERHEHSFNFPLDISWKSTNAYGWPQIVLHVYGVDVFGKDIIIGYGAVHVPCQLGRHHRKVAMFVPQSSSKLMKINAWLTGKRPEFINPNVIASGEGRGVTRVQTQGFLKVAFSISMKNMMALGYMNGQSKENWNEDMNVPIFDKVL